MFFVENSNEPPIEREGGREERGERREERGERRESEKRIRREKVLFFWDKSAAYKSAAGRSNYFLFENESGRDATDGNLTPKLVFSSRKNWREERERGRREERERRKKRERSSC